MENTGRYYIKDQATGRTFCIEPIAGRGEKINGPIYTNGGITGEGTKVDKDLGGSIRAEDSIITKENGYEDITTLRPGVSPNGYIEWLCKTGNPVGA